MIQPHFDKISYDTNTILGNVQTALSVKLNAKEEVLKILSVSVEPSINSYEFVNDEVVFSGKCNYKILLLDGNGVSGLNYSADFTDKLPYSGGKPRVFFDCTVIDSKHNAVNNIIEIESLLNVVANGKVTNECEVVVSGEEMLTKTCDFTYSNLVKSGNIVSTIEHECVANNSIGRVLSAESMVDISEYFVSGGVFNYNGTATVTVTYANPNAELNSQIFNFPFSSEVVADGFEDNMKVQLLHRISGTKIHIEIVEGAENNTFTAEIGLMLTLNASKVSTMTLVNDAYSVTNRLELGVSQIKSSIPNGYYGYVMDADNNITVNNGMERFIALVGVNSQVVKCVCGEQNATVEALVSGNVIYEFDGKIESQPFEIPIVKNIEDDWISPNLVVRATISICDISYKLDKDMISVSIKIKIYLESNVESSCNCVNSLEVKETVENKFGAIEVCIANKGDDIWDIAKSLCMKVEDILAVNPDIVSPLETDAKIVVYHRL